MLEQRKVPDWQIELANGAIEVGSVFYLEGGRGLQPGVVYQDSDESAPLHDANRRAARAVWKQIAAMPQPPKNEREIEAVTADLKSTWKSNLS